MKLKASNGIWGELLLSIMMILAGVFFIYANKDEILSINSAKYRYEIGDIYEHGMRYSSSSGYAISIDMAMDTGYVTEDDKQIIYLVAADDAYYFLLAERNDKIIAANLDEDGFAIFEEPIYLNIKVMPDSYGNYKKIIYELGLEDISQSIWTDDVLILNSNIWSSIGDVFPPFLFLIMGIVFAFMSVHKYRKNKEALEKLEEISPGLLSMADVYELASYYDEKLQLAILKDHIISGFSGFCCYPLKSATWMYKHKTITRAYGIIKTGETFKINMSSLEDNKLLLREIPVKFTKKYTDDAIDKVLYYIENNYPDIYTGFNDENKRKHSEMRKSLKA